MSRSRLNFPGPRDARYSHRKQYNTVISPPFRCGKKLCGPGPGGALNGPITVPKWLMKYATAISPLRMNATYQAELSRAARRQIQPQEAVQDSDLSAVQVRES